MADQRTRAFYTAVSKGSAVANQLPTVSHSCYVQQEQTTFLNPTVLNGSYSTLWEPVKEENVYFEVN